MSRLVALALVLSALPAGAVPLVVTQQGRLLDGSDHPVTGAHTMSFSLFRHLVHDPSTPDPAVWTGSYEVDFSDDGLYSVALGDPEVTANAPLDSAVLIDADPNAARYLEVAVDGETLAPRLLVSTVPYALVARSLSGGTVDAASIAVNGAPVVDANGEWVGPTANLDARYAKTTDLSSGALPVPWSAITGVPTLVQAGDGLTMDAAGRLDVKPGGGLDLENGAVAVRAGDGLQTDANNRLAVAPGSGLVIDAGKLAVDFSQANLDAKYLRLDATNALTGALRGTSAQFSGSISAASVTTSGEVDAASVRATGAVNAGSLSAGAVTASSLAATGDVSGASVTTTGAASADSGRIAHDLSVGGNLTVAGTMTVRPRQASVDGASCATGDEGTLFYDPTAKTFFACVGGQVGRLTVRTKLGASSATAGASCKDVLASGGSGGSGLYWIDPAKAAGQASNPFLAYCDMITDGGGWTLALHTYLSGGYPANGAFQQSYANWQTNGVGAVTDYQGSIVSSDFFVMPLESFRLLAKSSSSLRFESDHYPIHSELDGFTVSPTYALDGSNRTQVLGELCSGSPGNCFLRDNGSGTPGFSSYDVNHDHEGGSCNYNNVGWWYDDCYSYNAFRTDDAGHYAGYSAKDASTRHWSWWVR